MKYLIRFFKWLLALFVPSPVEEEKEDDEIEIREEDFQPKRYAPEEPSPEREATPSASFRCTGRGCHARHDLHDYEDELMVDIVDDFTVDLSEEPGYVNHNEPQQPFVPEPQYEEVKSNDDAGSFGGYPEYDTFDSDDDTPDCGYDDGTSFD